MELTTVAASLDPVLTRSVCEDGRARVVRVFNAAAEALYRFILVRVGSDRDVADDILQQTCCEATRQRWKAPTDDRECEAWLGGIARNLTRQHWRRLKRQGVQLPVHDPAVAGQLVANMEAGTLSADAAEREDVRRQLLLAVTGLPAADQQLVFSFYFDGRSQADIASECGVSPKSVEARLYRLRGRLRALLKDAERTG